MNNRAMKDSGIEWMGEIPENWEVKKYKTFSQNSMGTTILKEDLSESGFPVYSASQNGEIFGYISDIKKEVRKGDLVIPARGTIGYATYIEDLLATCTQTTIHSRIKDIANSKFIYYCTIGLHEYWFQFDQTAVPQLTVKQVKNNSTPLPPLHEQQAIANYLDDQVSRLDRLINDQQRVIEEWKAYKQSLITETVTKGLNPEVELKDSGIEWIGEIPSHWEFGKVKRDSYLKGRIGWQGLKADEFVNQGPFLVTGTDFKNGKVDWSTCVHITEDRYEEAYQIQLKNNDLLVTKDGTIGKLAIVDDLKDKASLNSGVFLVRNIYNRYVTKYFYYVMDSEIFWKYFNSTTTGSSTIIHLYQNIYKEFSYPLPPLHEQQQIADFLDEKCSKIDQLIEDKQRLIEDLKAYKQSLIYECVTGKKEVV